MLLNRTLHITKSTILCGLVVLLLVCSCQDLRVETKLNEQGNIIEKKTYDERGKLIEEIKFYERKPDVKYRVSYKKENFDSVVYFYDNGKIFKKGKRDLNSQLLGIWNLYDRTGNKREIREFFVYKGKARLNRAWFLNESGDTITWRGTHNIFKQKEFIHDTLAVNHTSYNYFKFNKDTIRINEPIRGIASCFSPLLEDYQSELRVVVDSKDDNFNADFSNEDDISVQIFMNLQRDTSNQKWFPKIEKEQMKYIAVFGSWYDEPGQKTLRGYMEEYAIGPFDGKDADSITYRTYFEKELFVLDSL